MKNQTSTQVYVQVHVLQAGHLTLPERFFVHPASDTARRTVPSLAFLLEHIDPQSGKVTRIVFDLGLRNPPTKYPVPIQKHIESRQPLTAEPDVVQSLGAGGLGPDDIDYVIYSHIHWDHIGDPNSFSRSTFVVGAGTIALLDGSSPSLRGSHSFFESDLLPRSRTIEMPPVNESGHAATTKTNITSEGHVPDFHQPWRPHGSLPQTMDIFQDGSVLLVDAPGHLPGHTNLLARTGPDNYVYLAGDTCHDRRLMTGEKDIGEWVDEQNHTCCIHADKEEAARMIARVRQLESEGVEVIFAHDVEWEEDSRNASRFLGAG